ncbi:Rop family plasmid primer RNA-binding protein [Klebsiella variicola subsp. variicola]|nr:Rop family plasmid primer RNA-binding protein [Klebsiella variicola subsp. variicola]PAU40734.1 Rop family plasmid primer RNA-binding protein [Klebsiella pneumoniae]
MTKQQKTALNMAKFIQNQSLLLLEKLNELDLDVEADLCEKLHDDAEHLFPYTVLETGCITGW